MRMVDRLIAAGLADRQTTPDNGRETVLRLTDEGRRAVEEVTARRRAELAAVVERLAPRRRAALVAAPAAFNAAGGEPVAPATDDAEPYPLGWAGTGAGGGIRDTRRRPGNPRATTGRPVGRGGAAPLLRRGAARPSVPAPPERVLLAQPDRSGA